MNKSYSEIIENTKEELELVIDQDSLTAFLNKLSYTMESEVIYEYKLSQLADLQRSGLKDWLIDIMNSLNEENDYPLTPFTHCIYFIGTIGIENC